LMSRCARERRVFFVEEAIFSEGVTPSVTTEMSGSVCVVVPQLPEGLTAAQTIDAQRRVLDEWLEHEGISDFILWYYTPMAMAFTRHWTPRALVYDCMDQLSAFKGAPTGMARLEAELMARASLVLTGGRSLYEARSQTHHNIHAFPSSVDVAHFAKARTAPEEPGDQKPLARPRLGYFGVIDERMDLSLIDGLADARPDWQFVMLGPVVKIDPASLPRRHNLHYLGPKSYAALPQYISSWDVALMPFARNDATRFISPTKTLEYMAAGKPVVSTSIRDVVTPYGDQGLVYIADDVDAFVRACGRAMTEHTPRRMTAADDFLRTTSWNDTWSRISALISKVVDVPTTERPAVTTAYTSAARAKGPNPESERRV
jgi:Glycosyl transferases group 1